MSKDSELESIKTFAQSKYKISIVLKFTEHTFFHAGIIHRNSETDTIELLHLAFHEKLLNQKLEDVIDHEYFFIHHHLHEDLQIQAAAYFRKIFRRKEVDQIPYGILFNGSTHFTREGEFLLGENFNGLTCSTFIIAAFLGSRITLLNVNEWPPRAIDKKWHDYILHLLENHSTASKEHIERVRQETFGVRFLPVEVAASLTFKDLPESFKVIEAKGEKFSKELLPEIPSAKEAASSKPIAPSEETTPTKETGA